MPAKKATSKKTSTKKTEAAVASPRKAAVVSPSSKNLLTRRNIILALVLLVIIIGLLLYLFRSMFIAAIAGGRVITRYELDRELEQKYGKATLETLILKNLIFSEMKKKGITVTDDQVQAEIKKAEDQLKQQGTSLEERLASFQMTRQDLEDQIRVKQMSEKLFANDIKVSSKEIDAYLEENKETLPQGQNEKELRTYAEEQIKQQKLTPKFQEWLSNLQKNANVQYFVSF